MEHGYFQLFIKHILASKMSNLWLVHDEWSFVSNCRCPQNSFLHTPLFSVITWLHLAETPALQADHTHTYQLRKGRLGKVFHAHNHANNHISFQPLLPSPFTNDDMHQLLQHCLSGQRKATAHVFADGIVVSEQFINECKKMFEPLIKEKAEKVRE